MDSRAWFLVALFGACFLGGSWGDSLSSRLSSSSGHGPQVLNIDGVITFRQVSQDGRVLINVPRQLPKEKYQSCKLENSKTKKKIACTSSRTGDGYNCHTKCADQVIQLLSESSNTDTLFGMWNLIGMAKGSSVDLDKTGFEVTKVRNSYPLRSVKYMQGKLDNDYRNCRLQDSAGTTIYCSFSDRLVDCNVACETFVDRVSDIESIAGNWTLIGEYYESKSETGFEITSEEVDTTETAEITTPTEPEASTVPAITDQETPSSTSDDEVFKSTTPFSAVDKTTQGSVIEPCRTGGSSQALGSQSDRVVVEMPGSLAADPDVHFALSLVPLLRGRTLRDTINARIDILTYLRSKNQY